MVQHDLFGAPAARFEHRLFFAAMPAADVGEKISAAVHQLRARHPDFQGSWQKPERYHATLAHLGDYAEFPPGLVDKALAAGHALSTSACHWVMDQVDSFVPLKPRWVLRSAQTPDGMRELHRALQESLLRSGAVQRMERSFTPHVTFAFSKREKLGTAPIEPILWPIDRIVLIHSLLGQTIYHTLGEWALRSD